MIPIRLLILLRPCSLVCSPHFIGEALKQNFVFQAHLFFFSRWEIKTCVLLFGNPINEHFYHHRRRKKKLSVELLKLRNLLMKFLRSFVTWCSFSFSFLTVIRCINWHQFSSFRIMYLNTFFLGFFSQIIIWIHGNLNKLHRNSRTREKINKKKFLLALFQLASFNLLYLFCWLMIGRVSTIETCHLNNGWEIRSGGKIVEPFWRARFNNWILKHYSSTH